jgi:hypothetical protein
VTGDLLAAAWTAADPLGGSLRERIQGCQWCCLGLEACFGLSLLGADTGQIGLQLPIGGRRMGQDAGEREYRPGLWMIQFTALDSQRATQCARQGSAAGGVLEVAAAGRYGFAAVGAPAGDRAEGRGDGRW